MSITITYGPNISFDAKTLPDASIEALLKRGSNHLFGNEQASKMVAWEKKFEAENKREATEDEYDAQRAVFQKAALEALLAGTVGTGSRGPAVDPVEHQMEVIARREVLAVLKENGIKAPKKDEAVTFGNNTQKTMDEMIATRIEKNEERIRKEASKVVADAKKKAEATKKAAAEARAKLGDGVVNPEALGL